MHPEAVDTRAVDPDWVVDPDWAEEEVEELQAAKATKHAAAASAVSALTGKARRLRRSPAEFDGWNMFCMTSLLAVRHAVFSRVTLEKMRLEIRRADLMNVAR
jgi:hypothetical protein